MNIVEFYNIDVKKFSLGRVVLTPGALELQENGVSLANCLTRHVTGDWGDLDQEDKDENEYSLEHDLRILSAYETAHGKLWIITEADRSATTLLLPSEY